MNAKEIDELNEWVSTNVIPECPHDRPAVDPVAALEVLKKCVDKIAWSNGIVVDRVPTTGIWIVCQEESKEEGGEADTLELAICQFAKALFSK